MAAAGLTPFVIDAFGREPLFPVPDGAEGREAFLRYVSPDQQVHLPRFAAQLATVNARWSSARERSPDLPAFPITSPDRVLPEVQVFLVRSVLGGRVDAAAAAALAAPLAWVRALIRTASAEVGEYPELGAMLAAADGLFAALDTVRAEAVALGGAYEAR